MRRLPQRQNLNRCAERQRGWLPLENLTAYSPDFNSIQCLCAGLKPSTPDRYWATKAALRVHLPDAIGVLPAEETAFLSLMKNQNRRYHAQCAFTKLGSSLYSIRLIRPSQSWEDTFPNN